MSKRMVDLKVEDGKITSINGSAVGGGTAVEANPQEEATQQLDKIKIDNVAYSIAGGGSGGSGFIIKNVSTYTYSSGFKDNLGWVSGRELKANTAYQIGDQVQIKYSKSSGNFTISKNEIGVPVSVNKRVSWENQKLVFGNVVLVCTNADYSLSSSKTNGTMGFSVFNLLTYTVVSAGTTGSDLTIPTSIMNDEEIIIAFYTMEPATA